MGDRPYGSLPPPPGAPQGSYGYLPPPPGGDGSPSRKGPSPAWTWVAVAVACLGVLLLAVALIGTVVGNDDAGVADPTTTDAPPTIAPAPVPPPTTDAPSTTSAPPNSTVQTRPERFVDPQGHYGIDVDPGWVRLPDPAPSVEQFAVGPADDEGFRPTLTLESGTSDVSLGLDAYVGAVASAVAGTDPEPALTVETGILEAADSGRLGTVEYGTSVDFTPRQHLTVIDLEHGQTAQATLLTSQADFLTVRSEVEAYLATLQVGMPTG